MPSRSHVHPSPGSTALGHAGVKEASGPRQHNPRSTHQHASGRNRPAPSASRNAASASTNAAVALATEAPVVIDGPSGRVVCIADVRGNVSLFNQIASETGARAIIHTGDFGFYERASFDRISDRTLRHLVQYSTLIDPSLRNKLLAPTNSALREQVLQHPGPLISEFPDLLTGHVQLNVPVFTVWGACEDVAIIERFRTGEYQVKNLHVLDEATTKAIEIGGIRLRLFGLGGAVVPHKLFDNGEGAATIAGGQGTMWTTALQIGQLVDTAQKTFDPTETRLLITHASPGREGLLAQLALALKADLTVSAGLHFRYGASYNEFSVQHDAENFRNKLQHAKVAFGEIWDTVKSQVDSVIDENQRILLNNALAVANRVPPSATAGGASGEEPAWKNTWNWNLPDAAYGSLVLNIKDGRVGAETKSQGFNFAYRRSNQPIAASGPIAPSISAPGSARAAAAVAPPMPSAAAQKPISASPAVGSQAVQPESVPVGTVNVPAQPIERDAPAGKSIAATPVTPSKPVRDVKEREKKERSRDKAVDSSALRSDLEGTSGTDGRKSPTGPRRARNPFTLYISQLKEALPVSEDEIRTYFGPAAGGISGVKLVFDKPHRRTTSSGKEEPEPQRRQRPFAYVEFKDAAAMAEGLKRQGEVIKNDIKPVLEHADSNKTVQDTASTSAPSASNEKKERPTPIKRRERSQPSETDKEKDDESGRSGRASGSTVHRPAASASASASASTPSTPAAGAGAGAGTSSQNRNKKPREGTPSRSTPKPRKDKNASSTPAGDKTSKPSKDTSIPPVPTNAGPGAGAEGGW